MLEEERTFISSINDDLDKICVSKYIFNNGYEYCISIGQIRPNSIYKNLYFNILITKIMRFGLCNTKGHSIIDCLKGCGDALISKKWVNNCFITFMSELKIKVEKQSLISFKHDEPIFETMMNMCNIGLGLMNDEKYDEAIEQFKNIENPLKSVCYKIVLYNIACCYSNKSDKINMLYYLKKAVDEGYDNWENALSDLDFKDYWLDNDFRDIIITMKNKI
jgi:hypothetical protein